MTARQLTRYGAVKFVVIEDQECERCEATDKRITSQRGYNFKRKFFNSRANTSSEGHIDSSGNLICNISAWPTHPIVKGIVPVKLFDFILMDLKRKTFYVSTRTLNYTYMNYTSLN